MPSLTQRYAESLWPDQVTILGRPLKAYCIGHALLLHRVGSPFMELGRAGADCRPSDDNGLGDLLLALWICSQDWQQALSLLYSQAVKDTLKSWGSQIQQSKDGPLAIVCAETQFSRYLAQAWDGPQFWETQRKEPVRTPGAPMLAALKVRIMASFGCSEEEALSRPIRAALFDTAAYAESQGALEIVGERELTAIEEMSEAARN